MFQENYESRNFQTRSASADENLILTSVSSSKLDKQLGYNRVAFENLQMIRIESTVSTSLSTTFSSEIWASFLSVGHLEKNG